MDVSIQEKVYDVGFILCRYMYESSDIKEYLGDFIKYLREILGLPVIMIVGKEEKNLEKIAKSYSTARRVRSFQGFKGKKRKFIIMRRKCKFIQTGSCFSKEKILIFS